MTVKKNAKIYIAGSLFAQSDITQRNTEKKYVLEKSKIPIDIFNPIEAGFNDKSTLPTANDIVMGDFNQLISTNGLLMPVHEIDMGNGAEVGMAFGINFMRSKILSLIESGNVTNESLLELLQEIPEKKIYGHYSDIRAPDAHNYQGRYVPVGLNQFYVGAIEKYGAIYPTYQEAANAFLKETN